MGSISYLWCALGHVQIHAPLCHNASLNVVDRRVASAARRCSRDGEAQEASHLHRHAERPVERLTALIFKHQHPPTSISYKRAGRPRLVEFVLQFVFLRKAIEACTGCVVGGRKQQAARRAACPHPPVTSRGERRVRCLSTRPESYRLSTRRSANAALSDSDAWLRLPNELAELYVRDAWPSSG